MSRQVTDSTRGAASAGSLSAEPHGEDSDAQARGHAPEAALDRDAGPVRDARDDSARWERLFDAITDPIGVVNADSRLVYANAAYRSLFDRVPDGVIGHECFSAHPNPSGGPCETCPVTAAIRSRRPAFVQSERPQRHATSGASAVAEGEGGATSDNGADQGARRVFQRWTYPVIAPDGSIDEVVEMIKDVTEQERLREASRQAEALRAADRLKAELLGTVSHELRSPLAAIKGYAGTLLRYDGRLPRSERHEFLTAIAQASDRLEAIIDQLLLMSQLETGLITPQRAPVDLRQLAREAVTGIERRLPHEDERTGAQHHVVVVDHTSVYSHSSTATASDSWWAPVVMGDRRLLRQALDEVLDNAVKYSPDGGMIELTLERLDARDQFPTMPSGTSTPVASQAAAGEPPLPLLALRVRDEGRGIPAEQLGAIFDRFHRGEGGLTRAFGGLGLGLAICKRVVELHGGTVRVASAPGQGTVFSLLLPLDRALAPDEVETAGALAEVLASAMPSGATTDPMTAAVSAESAADQPDRDRPGGTRRELVRQHSATPPRTPSPTPPAATAASAALVAPPSGASVLSGLSGEDR